SIVIGALGLVLGGRATPDLVRPGAAEAEVEALFDVSKAPLARERVALAGVDAGDEVVLRRVVQASGRSRAYLNGRLCTATQLAASGSAPAPGPGRAPPQTGQTKRPAPLATGSPASAASSPRRATSILRSRRFARRSRRRAARSSTPPARSENMPTASRRTPT